MCVPQFILGSKINSILSPMNVKSYQNGFLHLIQ